MARTPEVSLRKVRREDAGMLARWHNLPHVMKWFAEPVPLGYDETLDWIVNVVEPNPFDYMFIVQSDGRDYGTVSVNLVNREIGRVILGDEKSDSVMMQEAIGILFEMFGPASYVTRIDKNNDRAKKFYQKIGFRTVGTDGRAVLMAVNVRLSS